MKKIITNILAIAAVAVAFASCQKETTPTYSVTVKVTTDSTYPVGAEVPVYTVKVTNTSSATEVTAVTENGVAVISGLYSGVYSITAAATQVLGDVTFTLSASLDEPKSIMQDETVNLVATAVKASNLIFKEIYQGGCKNGEGEWDTYFRDQYYEIYNNGEETVYVDGLCIAECKCYNYDFSVKYTFDIQNPENYVFAQNVWQLPGKGTEYPLEPGESIIIAQLGINHKDSELSNKMSPVNLLCADFEAMNGDKELWDGTILPDGPALNMNNVVAAYSLPQWLTSVGAAAMVIFKPSNTMTSENMLQPIEAPSVYNAMREILIDDVLDAVNIVGDATRLTTLVLPNVLDAGCIWHSAPGSYTGESISRKIAGTREDGTIIYQDTNNTTEDFDLNKTPEVRRNGAEVPAWHNWN